jgi:hypothetical protein
MFRRKSNRNRPRKKFTRRQKIEIHRKLAILYDFKRTLKCAQCPEDHPACLEFHHEGEKDFSIGRAVYDGVSVERIFEEIAKCTVLCANCHRKVHYKEKRKYMEDSRSLTVLM